MPNFLARETITVSGAAGGLTAATYGEADRAFITVETAELRYTVDGTTATTSVGHLANLGDIIELESMAELSEFSAIRTTGVSASLQVSYAK